MPADATPTDPAAGAPGGPVIDVLIPVYNAAATIESAVRSIQDQTVRDIRIVVVNDGSTDGTAAILARMAAADPRLEIVDKPNSGIVDALNAGLAVCRAEFIARHDGDDLAAPGRFAAQLAYLRAHPDCAAVSGGVRHIDVEGRVLVAEARLRSPDLADPLHLPQIEPYLIHPFLMIRRSAIEAAGGYRFVFHAEDTDLYWRLQEAGTLVNMPDILGDYRIHAGSITGASVVNGRIAAINSQLAGLSALRRRRGEPDLVFLRDTLARYQAAGSLQGMMDVIGPDLTPQERDRLGVSSGLKLLELAGYRPYELDTEDCRFVRRTLAGWREPIPPENAALAARMISGTAARLLFQGRVAAALGLAPGRLYPAVLARLMLRVALPRGLRQAVRRAMGQSAAYTK